MESWRVFPYLCSVMARVFVIWLTFIYAFSATGATVHLHYCCGESQTLVMQPEYGKSAPEDCSLCFTHHKKKTEDPVCCTDEGNDRCAIDQAGHGHCQTVKVDAKKTTEEHLPGADTKPAKIYPLELLAFTLAYVINLPLDTDYAIKTADDAPPNTAVPLFIQHCTYRI